MSLLQKRKISGNVQNKAMEKKATLIGQVTLADIGNVPGRYH